MTKTCAARYGKGFFYLTTCILLSACILLIGCKKTEVAQVQKASAPKAKAANAVAVSNTPLVEDESYSYDPKGRRDPFFSVVALAKQKSTEKVKKKFAPPIESFDVSELKLFAIIWRDNHYFGMVGLPDGKSFTITEGTVLGVYGGKVEKIMKDSLIIKEYIKDYRGKLVPKDTTLKLHKEEEE